MPSGSSCSVELMVNAANINLAAFAHFGRGIDGQVFVLFTTALTVAEVVVGLALVLLLSAVARTSWSTSRTG